MVSMKPWSETWCRQFWDVLSHGKCEMLCSYQEYGSSWTETLEPLTRTSQHHPVLKYTFVPFSHPFHIYPPTATLWAGQRARFTKSIQKPRGGTRAALLPHLKRNHKSRTQRIFSYCFCCSFFMLEGIYSAFIIFLLKNFNLTGGWVWVVITSEGRERNPSVFLREKNGLTVIWWYILCS